jgi:hypothetical protein
MQKTNPAYPRWHRALSATALAGMLVGVSTLSGCGHLGTGCDCGPGATPGSPGAPPTPRIPLVTRPIVYTASDGAPPPASAAPTGTLQYPWHLPPQAQPVYPLADSVPLPALAPAPPPATEPPTAAPAPSEPEDQHAHTHTHTYSHSHSHARKHPHIHSATAGAARPATERAPTPAPRVRTPPRRAEASSANRRSTAATGTTASANRPPAEPVDCPNLLRTNPYLASQLRCPGATVLPNTPVAR